MTLPSGTLLQGGKYKIIKVLGQGGFGITYLAEHTAMKENVAVKEFFMKDMCYRVEGESRVTVPPTGSKAIVKVFREKFLREAKMIRTLNNPHIVRVNDYFEENDTVYYVMDFIPGESLKSVIDREGPLPEEKAIGYIKQICEALKYIHERNILHLDIKPSNILLDANGNAVLIDFGVSKHYDIEGNATSSTPVGISKGFAPVEQGVSSEVSEFKPATDIYALGATLYNLLTGKVPPEAAYLVSSELNRPKGLSDTVWNTILVAMKPSATDRPQSVGVFLDYLDGRKQLVTSDETVVKNEETIVSVEESKDEESPVINEKTRNRKWIIPAIAGAVIALVAVLVLIFSSGSEDNPSENKVEPVVAQREGLDFQVDGVDFHMVKVEGGEFVMGPFFTYEIRKNQEFEDDVFPVHKVWLSPFHIGETEVTQALWTAVMGDNPSEFKGPDFPVETVSYNDCLRFIDKLNQTLHAEGKLPETQEFRLPTEAEWEFAAKGGQESNGYLYSGSNDAKEVAIYDESRKSQGTSPVKSLKPNELGIYDMSGNVWEICSDIYDEEYYSYSAFVNPKGPTKGDEVTIRGGSWLDEPEDCNVVVREEIFKDSYDKDNCIGLRLVLAPKIGTGEVKVTGFVYESVDPESPVIGASVLINGSYNKGTVTDIEGKFTLSVHKGDYLQVECIGYEDGYVSVDGTDTLKVFLDYYGVMEGEKVSGTLSKHEYADLGLSVKWATCNIGAEKPEYDGGHFAWGELTAKDKCTWENYSHTSFIDSTTLTFKKYTPEDYNHRLSLSDDVARQKWGSPWRIPTRDQAEELIMFTCRKATIRGSQHGYLLTGPSGNSIFLPMSGQVTEEGLNWVGNYGYYWTSDLHDDNKYYETADVLFLSSDEFVLGYKYRYKGYSIRPVAE